MKVQVIYDFNVEEIEDFSNDIVKIEMSFEDFSRMRMAISKAIWNSELEIEKFYFKDLLNRLDNYETFTKD